MNASALALDVQAYRGTIYGSVWGPVAVASAPGDLWFAFSQRIVGLLTPCCSTRRLALVEPEASTTVACSTCGVSPMMTPTYTADWSLWQVAHLYSWVQAESTQAPLEAVITASELEQDFREWLKANFEFTGLHESWR